MPFMVLATAGVLSMVIAPLIAKLNRDDGNQLNLTINEKTTINETTVKNNDTVNNDEIKQNGNTERSNSSNNKRRGRVRIEKTKPDNLINESNNNAKQNNPDNSGNNNCDSGGTDASTTNTKSDSSELIEK